MKDKHITRHAQSDPPIERTDWAKIRRLSEAELDEAARSDPDAQPTDSDFWQDADLVMPETKQSVTLRLDRDVLGWFRSHGKGYQTRINAVLRAYVDRHKRAG